MYIHVFTNVWLGKNDENGIPVLQSDLLFIWSIGITCCYIIYSPSLFNSQTSDLLKTYYSRYLSSRLMKSLSAEQKSQVHTFPLPIPAPLINISFIVDP